VEVQVRVSLSKREEKSRNRRRCSRCLRRRSSLRAIQRRDPAVIVRNAGDNSLSLNSYRSSSSI
jgi:transcriptional regulator NrdR family protein